MLALSSYSESRETQQPLCGTRPHSQATADGPEGGPGILTLDKTPWGLNPETWGEGLGRGQEWWGAGVYAGWGPRASFQLGCHWAPRAPSIWEG